jgi:hypothetical protein
MTSRFETFNNEIEYGFSSKWNRKLQKEENTEFVIECHKKINNMLEFETIFVDTFLTNTQNNLLMKDTSDKAHLRIILFDNLLNEFNCDYKKYGFKLDTKYLYGGCPKIILQAPIKTFIKQTKHYSLGLNLNDYEFEDEAIYEDKPIIKCLSFVAINKE